jgi:hypothetical protein
VSFAREPGLEAPGVALSAVGRRTAASIGSARTGAVVAASERFGATRSIAVADLRMGAGGLATPTASAAAPAAPTPAPTPDEMPPSQAKSRCGAAAANADQTTVRRPR